MRLLVVEAEVRRRNELFVSVWVPHDWFFAQLDETAFGQRTKRLIVQGGLLQKLRRTDRAFQSQNRLQKFRLPGSASPQFFKFLVLDFAAGLDEQLFFPSDFRTPYDLRQQTAHYYFDWAAIISADPFG